MRKRHYSGLVMHKLCSQTVLTIRGQLGFPVATVASDAKSLHGSLTSN